MLRVLQAAASNASSASGLSVSVASSGAALPGLPPTASAGSFVRVLQGSSSNASSPLPALLLSDFDAAFQGSTFQSSLYDNISTVDADSIAAAAVVVARAAHALALGDDAAVGAAAELPVNYTAVQVTVQALMQVWSPGRDPEAFTVQRVARLAAACGSSGVRASFNTVPAPIAAGKSTLTLMLPSQTCWAAFLDLSDRAWSPPSAPLAVPDECHSGPGLPHRPGDDDACEPGPPQPLHRHPAQPHSR